ncbi:CgeB family protein [Pyxidicoccus parkwayensis]|nr:glycosyltransferase [Pyxidicoccus parkwaysis]
MRIVILGLSMTSSWGNGHATIFRELVREMVRRGHDVLFLERDMPWFAAHRDLPLPPWGRTELYQDLADLSDRFTQDVRDADLVVVGSYVPQGVEVGRWVQATTRGIPAFYDLDTAVTLAKLARSDFEYLSPDLIPGYRLYLSVIGGPMLRRIERELGSPAARALYRGVDPELYLPRPSADSWDLGYLGTYGADRQPTLERLMLEAARVWRTGRFVVAGPQYPAVVRWTSNVERVQHLSPSQHPEFYGAQRFTLSITRADRVLAGYSPGARLFEAAACGVPIISDVWNGVESVFVPGEEILLARTAKDTLGYLRDLSEEDRRTLGAKARARVLAEHTSAHRALAVEQYAREASSGAAAAGTPVERLIV